MPNTLIASTISEDPMKTSKADKLRTERQHLIFDVTQNGTPYERHQARIGAIDIELSRLHRRKAAQRLYRETLYDLNGHHGRA